MNKQTYEGKLHFFGRTSVTFYLLISFLVPIIITFGFGLYPTKIGFIAGVTQVLTLMIPISIAEFLSYAPIVGPAGFYNMSISGNLSNLKIPAAVSALEVSKCDPSTEEGELVSGLAMTSSTMTTEIIMLIGILLMVPLTGVFQNQLLAPAFKEVVPAIFGALTASYIIKNIKVSILPIGFATIYYTLMKFTSFGKIKLFGLPINFFSLVILIITSLVAARIAFTTGVFKKRGEVYE